MANQNGKSVVVRILTEPQQETNETETSPLNQRGRDNSSDASSAASAVHSEQSTKKLIEDDMTESRQNLAKIGIDFLLLCCVSVPIMLFFLIGEPYERGFFCDDKSLLHPYHKSTIKHWMLYVFGLIMPILIILAVETVRGKSEIDHDRDFKLFRWNVPVFVQDMYKYIGFFVFGSACCQLTTEIAKYSIGRFRPHFLTVCRPIMPDGTNCSNPLNLDKYIEEFTCSNPQVTAKILKDMRMSFPSANSSFSFYAMMFCVLYLHSRMSWNGSKLLKYLLQFALLMMAWFTSLTRISDYKHHWSDVLAGALLGVAFAFITRFCITIFGRRRSCDKLPTINPELNSNTHGNGS